jgi:deoxycytidine triphosphate deaminase
MTTQPDESIIKKLRENEIKRLSELPEYPNRLSDGERGVLLSDHIRQYADEYKLIEPFNEDLLRPAGYDLCVGCNYSILNETKALNDGMQLEIGPYQVAIIETYETLNLPKFVIGRWNIRVSLAYKGLLWVGGAQVDPGFRGRLCCPIYNLSATAVTLEYRQPLAMIDFVTTTKFIAGASKQFNWANRKMVVFHDYPKLNSGIEAEVHKFRNSIDENNKEIKEELSTAAAHTERSFREMQTRMDTFAPLVFTIVAVLFAGLGVLATKSSEPSLVATSLSLVSIAAVALYFALRPYYLVSKLSTRPDAGSGSVSPTTEDISALLRVSRSEKVVASILIIFSLGADAWSVGNLHHTKIESRRVTEQMVNDVESQKRALEKEIEELRIQSKAKTDELEIQVQALRQTKKDK